MDASSSPVPQPPLVPDAVVGPAGPLERIATIDILRGFALFGVVLVNAQSMIPWDNLGAPAEQWTEWIYTTFIGGRFYRLFAFLFGLGFVLQMQHLQARGAACGPIYLRRLAILLIFGVIHGLLLWSNDILALFAQFGFLLFLLRRWSDRSLLWVAIASLLLSHVYYFVSTGFRDFYPVDPVVLEQRAEERALAEEAAEAETTYIRSEGTWGEVMRYTAKNFLSWRLSMQSNLALLGEEFLMILLGFYVGRWRIFERLPSYVPHIRKVKWGTLVLAIIGYFMAGVFEGLHAPPGPEPLIGTARLIVDDISKAAGALFYATAITLLMQKTSWKRLLYPLASLGRMSLTHYLALSVILSMVFHDYGLGLYGRLNILDGVLLAIGIYIFQLLFSHWWLKFFRFGPMEWIWRSLTYGKWQALKTHTQ